MHWMTELGAPLGKAAIWGAFAYLAFKYFVNQISQSIPKLLDRVRKIGPAELDPPTVQSDEKPKPPELLQVEDTSASGASAGVGSAFLDPLMSRTENGIWEWAQQIPPNARERSLVKALANWQIGWYFEVAYQQSLGSQISLLTSLNSSRLNIQYARQLYEIASAQAPEYYANHNFDAWLGWLVNTQQFVDRTGDMLDISQPGREFLKYILQRSYTFHRFG